MGGLAGEQSYRGGIDCVVVSFDVPVAEAAKSIRVGFLHVLAVKDEARLDSQGSEVLLCHWLQTQASDAWLGWTMCKTSSLVKHQIQI